MTQLFLLKQKYGTFLNAESFQIHIKVMVGELSHDGFQSKLLSCQVLPTKTHESSTNVQKMLTVFRLV